MSEPRWYCAECDTEIPDERAVHGSGAGAARCPHDGARLFELQPGLTPGTVIDGRYTLQTPLGEGGMGVVFSARQHSVDREVAIKLMSASAKDTKLVRRFLREARAAASIEHPGVVSIFDFGTTDEGMPFLVMELMRGRSLKRVNATDAPLEPMRAARIAMEIAEALAATHARGLLHRDLKPANVFLTTDPTGRERSRVLDFGLAKKVDADADTLATLTTTGELLGTPVYMPPEQFLGKTLGPESDLYALGCVLYEMLTGSPPFLEDTVFLLLRAHVHDPPPPLTGAGGKLAAGALPEGLESLCLELLTKPREARPGSAAALTRRLAPFAGVVRSADVSAVSDVVDTAGDAAADDALGQPGLAEDHIEADDGLLDDSATNALLDTPAPDGPRRFRPPLVGRERECEYLLDTLETCFSEARPHIVVLEGCEGVGVSRLIEWTVGRALAREARVVAAYRDLEHDGLRAPLRALLDALFESEDLDREDLAQRLDELATAGGTGAPGAPVETTRDDADDDRARESHVSGLSPRQHDRLLDFLRPDEATSDTDDENDDENADDPDTALYDALVAGLLLGAAARPTLLVLDDLRAMSPADRELLEHVGQALDGSSAAVCLMLGVTTQDDAANADGDASASDERRPHHRRIRRLDDAAMRELVAHALPDASTAIVEHVVSASEGTPLHALQLLRALFDDDIIHHDSDGVVFRDGREPPPPSQRLDTVLDTRVEQLRSRPDGGEHARAVLVRVAIFGLRVPRPLLELMLDLEGKLPILERLDDTLRALEGDGWIRGGPPLDDARTIAFEHRALRDALMRRYGKRRMVRKLRRQAEDARETWASGER